MVESLGKKGRVSQPQETLAPDINSLALVDQMLDQNKQTYKKNDSNNCSFDDTDIEAERQMVEDNIEGSVGEPDKKAKQLRNKEILEERMRLLSRKEMIKNNPKVIINPIPVTISIEEEIQNMLKEVEVISIPALYEEIEDVKLTISRSSNKPFQLKKEQNKLQQYNIIVQKHAQLVQPKIQKILDDLEMKSIEEAVDELHDQEEKLASYLPNKFKARQECQKIIDKINELLNISGRPKKPFIPQVIQSDHKPAPNKKEQIIQQINQSIIQQINPQTKTSNIDQTDQQKEIEPDSLFEREKEDAENHAAFMKSAPECFEKSVRILIHILYQILDKKQKLKPHDKFLDVPTSSYEILITTHLTNVKKTFNGEVIKNKQIMDKVNQLEQSYTTEQQYQKLLASLKEIQPLISRFSFQEFFSYIEKADQVSQRVTTLDIVLLLGTTGAGKSTTIHYICGSEMYQTTCDLIQHIAFRKVQNEDLLNVKVSPYSRSETRYIRPIKIQVKGPLNEVITLVDTPGLFDLKNAEVDVSNQIGIIKALSQVKSVKPYIIFSYKKLGSRGEDFKQILTFYAQMIIDSDYLKDFNFFFTHVDQDVKIENLTAKITDIYRQLNSQEKQNERLVQFLKIIIDKAENNKIFVINPLDSQKVPEILQKIMNSKDKINSPYEVFQKAICQESKNKIIEQFDLHQKEILSSFKNANAEKVSHLLSELKRFCEIMDSDQDYKLRVNEILKKLILRMNDKHAEVCQTFKKQFQTGNKIGEQEVGLYESNWKFMNSLETVRKNYLCQIDGSQIEPLSYQDLELDIEKIIRDAYDQINKPQPAKLDSQNLHDYFQKLEMFVSKVQTFLFIRNDVFKIIENTLKSFPKRADTLLSEAMRDFDKDYVNYSTVIIQAQSAEEVSSKQQNDIQEDQNHEAEEEKMPFQLIDEFSNLLGELERAENISKDELRKVIKIQKDSVLDKLKKNFKVIRQSQNLYDFQKKILQNQNNLTNLSEQELNQLFDIKMAHRVQSIIKYFQLLDCFLRSMIQFDLSQESIDYIQLKKSKINSQMICWFNVQEEKLKRKVSQDKRYSEIKSIYEELMLVQKLPAMQGQSARQQRIKTHLTKLVQDKSEEAKKHMASIEKIVNSKQLEDGKSKDNQQISMHTLVSLKDAISTINDLQWTIENGNEDFWDEHYKDLEISLCKLVLMIEESVRFQRESKTNVNYIAETDQAFKQISEIQKIADIIKIKLPDINIDEFIPEIEQNLTGAQNFLIKKGIIKVGEESKIDSTTIDELLKKSECEKFYKFYTYLSTLQKRTFMIKKIDELSAKTGQKLLYTERIKELNQYFKEFVDSQMYKIKIEFKTQLEDKMKKYLGEIQKLKVDNEGFYDDKEHEDKASEFLNDYLIYPVDRILSIYKMITELKTNYELVWKKISPHDDEEEQLQRPLLKFYNDVNRQIALAGNNQVTVTNNLKIINQMIPLDQYIHDQNETSKNQIQAQYDAHFNNLIHFNVTVVKTVTEFIACQNYEEIKDTLRTLQQLDGQELKSNLQRVLKLLNQRCNQLCNSIAKDSRILVKGKQLDPQTMEKISNEQKELQEILDTIGSRFLDEKIFKKAQDLIKNIKQKMRLDFKQLEELINEFINSQKFKEANEYIINFYDSAKMLDIQQYDSPQSEEGQKDQQDYYSLIQNLKITLRKSIQDKIDEFKVLRNKSESNENEDDDIFLEQIIKKSPKDIVESLESIKNDENVAETFARDINDHIESVFNARIIHLREQIGERSDYISKKLKKYQDFCKKLPNNLKDKLQKEITEIQEQFENDQTKQQDDILNSIQGQSLQTVYDRLIQIKYNLNNKCQASLNEFYIGQCVKTLNLFKNIDLKSSIQDNLHQLFQFKSTDSINRYLDSQANAQYLNLQVTIENIYNSIIKRISALFSNKETQIEFQIKIDDRDYNRKIDDLRWFVEFFQKYKNLATDTIPNYEQALQNLIEYGVKEISKWEQEFSDQIINDDPTALSEVIRIIVYMRNISNPQEILTSLSFKDDPTFAIKQEQFAKLNESSNKKNFGHKFAAKYKAIAQQVSQAQFINPRTEDLEKDRIQYYENLEKCFSFVQLSQQVHQDLLEFGIDTSKDNAQCEKIFQQNYKDIEEQALTLTNNLQGLKSKQFKELNIIFENLKIIQNKFKSQVPSNFEQLKQKAIRIIQQQTDMIKKDIESKRLQTQALTDTLIFVQDIVQNVAQLKDIAQGSIADILETLQKYSQDQTIISDIAYMLKKSPVGSLIVEQQQIFICESRTFWANKIEHKGIDYVLENLLKNDGNKLADQEKQQLKKQYESFVNEYKNLVDNFISPYESIPKNKEQIKANILELTQKSKQSKIDKQQKNEIYKILANLFALWTISDFHKNKLKPGDMSNPTSIKYLLQPHPSQVISIFRMLGHGYQAIISQDQSKLDTLKKEQLSNQLTNNDIFFDNLVQIKTGEGKSITLAIVISVFALWDFQVSCACYSQYLSTRDFNSFSDLFIFLNIQEKIFYGTFNEICERYINKDGEIRNLVLNTILKDSQIQIQALPQTKKRVILIDEVDVFFSKDFYNKLYVPVAQIKNIKVSNLLDFMWQNRTDSSFTLKKLRDSQEYKECQELFKEKYSGILEEACKEMVWAARNFQTHNYVVQNNNIGYQEMDQISFKKSYGYNTIFAKYYHYETARDGQKVSLENLQNSKAIEIYCGQFSYAEIPLYSMLILGVTGTLDSLTPTENKIIRDVFQIKNFTFSPSVYGKNKLQWASLDPNKRLLIQDESDYYNELTNEIKSKMKGDNCQRAVLVFFKNLDLLKKFKQSQQYLNLKCEKQELSELCEEKEKENIIIQATYQNTLTLTTRSFGRGTDFICRDDLVEKNGGVHVILTFVPELHSEFIQIQGRTARQGNNGSFQMILKDTDLQEINVNVENEEFKKQYDTKLEYIFKQRDEKILKAQQSDTNAVAQIKAIHLQALKIKDFLVKNDANNSSKISDYLIKINAGPSIQEDQNPVKTLILMDATGSMSSLLVEAKNSVNLMYERSAKILEQHNLGSHLNWIQYACYRNYSSQDLILQHSVWESKPEKLKNFMDSIDVSGGMGNEAVEIGFQHAVSEEQNCGDVPLRQVYLIGDMPPNTNDEVDQRRSDYGFDQNPKFKQPAYWKTELEKLKKKNIKVFTFYVDYSAKSSFEEIAKMTGGTCSYLDVNDSESQEILLRSFVPNILKMIGDYNQNGDKDLGKKMAAEYMNCYR